LCIFNFYLTYITVYKNDIYIYIYLYHLQYCEIITELYIFEFISAGNSRYTVINIMLIYIIFFDPDNNQLHHCKYDLILKVCKLYIDLKANVIIKYNYYKRYYLRLSYFILFHNLISSQECKYQYCFQYNSLR